MVWSRLLCGAALAVSWLAFNAPASAMDTPPVAEARPQMEVSLAYFMDRLGLFGRWLNHPKWGEVWQPDAGADFRPYFYGYWQDTEEYGWFWVSNEPYGDIVYHYGRWVFDPRDGWLWVPGYVWGPSWVVWRESDTDIGWLPMPPGYADFDQGAGISAPLANDTYGYDALYGSNFIDNTYYDLWVFVGNEDFGVSRRRHYKTGHDGRDRVHHSRDRTHYIEDRDHVVDRSIDRDALSHETHREFVREPAERFMRRGAPVTSISEAKNIFRQEHERALNEPPAAPGPAGAMPRGKDVSIRNANGRGGKFPLAPNETQRGAGELNSPDRTRHPLGGRFDRPEGAQGPASHPVLAERPFSRVRGEASGRGPAAHEPLNGPASGFNPHTDNMPNRPGAPRLFHAGPQPAGLSAPMGAPFGAGAVHGAGPPPGPVLPISPANMPSNAPHSAIPQAPAAQFAPPEAAAHPAAPNFPGDRHRGP